ncbi:MAG: hypothetical protein ACREBU_02925 [Nitrososphaera sp.]
MSDEPTQYPYSVKIERTSKGARYSVHVHNTGRLVAMDEAVAMYVALGKSLESQGQAVAPVEKGGKSD